MLNVKLERYLNTFWRKDEAKSFASLSELENWIFDQMQQDYSRNTWAMSFPTPASARNIHADGPWAIKFQPIPGETTISIHQIESSEGIIFSDGRRTAGRKYWTDEVQAWLTHCEQRRRVPQFNFASGEKPLTRKLWARLGVSLRITAEEEAVIFGADETLSEETLRKIILDGRFTPDGLETLVSLGTCEPEFTLTENQLTFLRETADLWERADHQDFFNSAYAALRAKNVSIAQCFSDDSFREEPYWMEIYAMRIITARTGALVPGGKEMTCIFAVERNYQYPCFVIVPGSVDRLSRWNSFHVYAVPIAVSPYINTLGEEKECLVLLAGDIYTGM